MKERKKGQLNVHAVENVFLLLLIFLLASLGKFYSGGEFLGITITRYAGIKYAGINMRGDIIFH